ncbi:hypothetical protein BDN72DRAFT_615889 [Pluteus cervinus]|uniref:Uncharacterized protein n=1 Tax=Pluteus cervinus TaxID=181527 RepID=A0ACD3AVF3_9AGAR|nr:hypothetical protein BDN72DRAFT_615889 [Pluteus cervinus]
MWSHFVIISLLTILSVTVAEVNFDQCLSDFRNQKFGHLEGGRDNQGNPVSNYSEATALTYFACLEFCGGDPEPYSWTVFSQQFSAWLLPWLALLSQLPLGARDILDNLGSVVLTVGSPTLAAYSLAITVMNGRWIAQHLMGTRSHNIKTVVRVLSRLQQAPLEIKEGPELISMLKLRENNGWWNEMLENLSFMHTWSIAAATSIAWVLIAYIFTVVDSFSPGDITQAVNANGQGIGSQWLFLLALVVGWLQLSPKCDAKRTEQAFEKANDKLYTESSQSGHPPKKLCRNSSRHAFRLRQDVDNELRRDEYRAPPVYNYMRVLPWTQQVLKVSAAYRTLEARRVAASAEEDPLIEGFASHPMIPDVVGLWDSGVLSRITVASAFSLILQWGTTGAALVVTMFTPTKGLGCRSVSFLAYAVTSTIIWAFLLLSSFLSHSVLQMYTSTKSISRRQQIERSLLKWFSILLRRLSKLLCICNSIWIVLFCCFQFTNFYDRCWCNSSVIGLGAANAYNVMDFTDQDKKLMRQAWIGGVVLGVGSAGIYATFITLQLNPPMPSDRKSEED